MDEYIKKNQALCCFSGWVDQYGDFHEPDEMIEYQRIEQLTVADVVQVVRCRDCKHRPTGTDRNDLEFPDDKCPCKCEDFWYSWKPLDDWFCGNGERKDGYNG